MAYLWSYQNGDLVQILPTSDSNVIHLKIWFDSCDERVEAMLCVCSSAPSKFPGLKLPKFRVWVLLNSCNRGRLLVGARLIYVKQKVFLPKVWLCTMKVHGNRFQPWFAAVIFPKYWTCFPCKSSILRLITLTINSKWNSGPVGLLLEKGKKKENSWNLK